MKIEYACETIPFHPITSRAYRVYVKVADNCDKPPTVCTTIRCKDCMKRMQNKPYFIKAAELE